MLLSHARSFQLAIKNATVQVRKLVDRKLQTPLFSSFLKGDFFHLKFKSWHPIKVHE